MMPKISINILLEVMYHLRNPKSATVFSRFIIVPSTKLKVKLININALLLPLYISRNPNSPLPVS